jgi:ATP-binding cassette subfamily B protein
MALTPYLLRHGGMLAAALVALIVSAGATLAVPLAIRRMIDLGFSGIEPDFIDKYFATLIGIGIVLALASATRFYAVNWLGERVVADIRRDVFKHLTGLSPAFYDISHSGEVMSRLTADTTRQASGGKHGDPHLAQYPVPAGATVMMVVTSLAARRAHRHSGSLCCSRLWPIGEGAFPPGAGHARAGLGLCRREPHPGEGAASLHV